MSVKNPEFDQYAGSYDEALGRGLSATGESREYFAERRVRWLGQCLSELAPSPRVDAILDYGCGTGSTVPLLRGIAPTSRVLGVDPSGESIEVARQTFATHGDFLELGEYRPSAGFCLAYCNGIFHHIIPEERLEAAQNVRNSLRPGGLFSFWENNPWNPGTRWVMSRIPFDRDAIPLSYREAKRLVWAAGFEILRVDFLFLFPKFLRPLRAIEQRLSRFPAGAQYQILCRRR